MCRGLLLEMSFVFQSTVHCNQDESVQIRISWLLRWTPCAQEYVDIDSEPVSVLLFVWDMCVCMKIHFRGSLMFHVQKVLYCLFRHTRVIVINVVVLITTWFLCQCLFENVANFL